MRICYGFPLPGRHSPNPSNCASFPVPSPSKFLWFEILVHSQVLHMYSCISILLIDIAFFTYPLSWARNLHILSVSLRFVETVLPLNVSLIRFITVVYLSKSFTQMSSCFPSVSVRFDNYLWINILVEYRDRVLVYVRGHWIKQIHNENKTVFHTIILTYVRKAYK